MTMFGTAGPCAIDKFHAVNLAGAGSLVIFGRLSTISLLASEHCYAAIILARELFWALGLPAIKLLASLLASELFTITISTMTLFMDLWLLILRLFRGPAILTMKLFMVLCLLAVKLFRGLPLFVVKLFTVLGHLPVKLFIVLCFLTAKIFKGLTLLAATLFTDLCTFTLKMFRGLAVLGIILLMVLCAHAFELLDAIGSLALRRVGASGL
jgi:hypothetical protein